MDAPSPDLRLPLLDELEQALRELLARLEERAPDALLLQRSRERCAACVARYRALDAELGPPSGDEHAGIHDALGRAVRLNAVAACMAQREAHTVRAGLEQLGRARRVVERSTGGSATGVSCDVAG